MALYVGITALNRSASVRVPGFTEQQDEEQSITVDAAGGNFTVSYKGQTTANQAFNVSAGNLETALEGLSTIGPDNVSVSGGPGASGGGTPYVVTFIGDLGNEDVPALTTAAGGLTGGAGTAVVAEDQKGGSGEAAPTRLVPGTVTVVDLDDAATRKALNSHHAIGQWVVVTSHNTDGTDALPENS